MDIFNKKLKVFTYKILMDIFNKKLKVFIYKKLKVFTYKKLKFLHVKIQHKNLKQC